VKSSQVNNVKRRTSRRPEYIPADPLLTAREAATERGQGVSTFWRDVKNGLVPPPIRIGKQARRWRLSAIQASIDACDQSKSQLLERGLVK